MPLPRLLDLLYPLPVDPPGKASRSIRMDRKRPAWTIKDVEKPAKAEKRSEPRSYTHGEKTEAIIAALSAGEFVSIASIVEATGAGKSTVEGVLSRADKRGEIEKKVIKGAGRARYKYYRMRVPDAC